MSMTLEEMKLAVCEKLPELVTLVRCNCGLKSCSIQHTPKPYWIGCKETGGMNRRINWPTEGLQVCHEAEKLIHNECPETRSRWFIYLNSHEWAGLSATYEQRLEALCRVWFPERF